MKAFGNLLPALLLAAGVAAQPQQLTVPSVTAANSINYPVAGPPMRYQQWIAPSEFLPAAGGPVRVTMLELIGGFPGGQTGTTLDLEVTMANGPTTQPSLAMDQNLTNPFAAQQLQPVVVYPRPVGPQPHPVLGTAIPGGSVLQLPFSTPFIWDGSSAVVVDIKVFGNGMLSQPFPYELAFTTRALGTSWRLFGLGPNPRSVLMATFTQPNAGIQMLFTYELGLTVPYGQGCAGAGGVTPVASTTNGRPVPANRNWTQNLDQANSGVNALLLIGFNKDTWSGVSLPLDLAFIGAPTCSILTEVILYLPAVTVGGGPGAGSATIRTPIPPVTVFTGLSMYTQWLVADMQSPNGMIAMSHGLWHVFQ